MNDTSLLNRAADNIRVLTAAMVEKAKSGHPGGAMGGADFTNVLYSEFLVYDPEDPQVDQSGPLLPGSRDTCRPMLYSVLAMAGFYTMDDLKSFRQWGSITPGHPEVDVMHGIENTSGPLGQGHTMAVGAAIAERFMAARFGEWCSHKIYAFISDGGIQEEISQGAGRVAGFLGLHNLIMFFDSNDVQLSTDTDAVTDERYGREISGVELECHRDRRVRPCGHSRCLGSGQPRDRTPHAHHWQDHHGPWLRDGYRREVRR